MVVSLFSFVDMYRRQLDTAAHLLAKGAAFAAEQGVSDADMLDWRLADDMHPLRFQLGVIINFTARWPARVIGAELPDDFGDIADVAGFQAAIAAAKAYLATLTPAQFAGRDDVPLTTKLGDALEPTMPSGQWLSGFATTNIYFHLSMVYAILRMKGAKIGKLDLFAGGL